MTFVWGANDHGQLANRDRNDSGKPSALWIKKLKNTAVSVSISGPHAAAVTKSGSVWAWGWSGAGQTARYGKAVDTKMALKVPTIREPCCSVSCGGAHTLVLTRAGQVWAFGDNRKGQLGLGHNGTGDLRPALVPKLSHCVAVAAGAEHSAALCRVAGDHVAVFTWGSNASGQLGRRGGALSGQSPGRAFCLASSPAWRRVSCGGAATAVVGGGRAKLAGKAGGAGSQGAAAEEFAEHAGLLGVEVGMVALGEAHAVAVSADGRSVFAWGVGAGACAEPGVEVSDAKRVEGIDGSAAAGADAEATRRVVSVAAGRAHSIVATASGLCYAWGENRAGQLGVGKFMGALLRPTLCRAPDPQSTLPAGLKKSGGLPLCVRVCAGGDNSACLAVDGREVDAAVQTALRATLEDDAALVGSSTAADRALAKEELELERMLKGESLNDVFDAATGRGKLAGGTIVLGAGTGGPPPQPPPGPP
jgi:alpha-tubulin suppressor-like RCC1 family protein